MNAREFLAAEERRALADLRRTVGRLGRDLGDLSLVPAAARRHPRTTVAGAVVLGLAAGALLRPLGRAARAGLSGLVPVALLARVALRLTLRRLARD